MRTRHVWPALLGLLGLLCWSTPVQSQQPTIGSRDYVWAPVQAPRPSLALEGRRDKRASVAVHPRARPVSAVRPAVRLPANPPRVESRSGSHAPAARGPSGTGSISGKASWYCGLGSPCPHGYSGGPYAAAGPGLRAAICGNQASNCWRGMTVTVNGKPIKLVDWCQCYWRQPNEKLIDLFHDAWVATGARGGVVITW